MLRMELKGGCRRFKLDIQFFGGRGASSGSGTGGAGGTPVTSVTTQSGDTLDLSKMPLIYGNDDPAVSGALRTATVSQEQKRLKAKSEYAQCFDVNGNPVGMEAHGGRSSVSVPYIRSPRTELMTHNHPRGKGEEGLLGGTFSDADLYQFSGKGMKTIRASAAEGTYSMSKTSLFDEDSFDGFVKNISKSRKSEYDTLCNNIDNKYFGTRTGKVDYQSYFGEKRDAFNGYLINLHNDLLAGQKQYGYTYTLERRS